MHTHKNKSVLSRIASVGRNVMTWMFNISDVHIWNLIYLTQFCPKAVLVDYLLFMLMCRGLIFYNKDERTDDAFVSSLSCPLDKMFSSWTSVSPLSGCCVKKIDINNTGGTERWRSAWHVVWSLPGKRAGCDTVCYIGDKGWLLWALLCPYSCDRKLRGMRKHDLFPIYPICNVTR